LVEGVVERGAAVPGGTEHHALPRRGGIGLPRVVGGHQSRHVDERGRIRRFPCERAHVHHWPPVTMDPTATAAWGRRVLTGAGCSPCPIACATAGPGITPCAARCRACMSGHCSPNGTTAGSRKPPRRIPSGLGVAHISDVLERAPSRK